MGNKTYALPELGTLLSHGPAALPAWLHDLDESGGREYTQDDALVASGDYFLVLITRLDKLTQSMPQDSAEQIELENIIQSLFYTQQHYLIKPKRR